MALAVPACNAMPVHGADLVFFLMYVWSREYPTQTVNIMGVVTLEVRLSQMLLRHLNSSHPNVLHTHESATPSGVDHKCTFERLNISSSCMAVAALHGLQPQHISETLQAIICISPAGVLDLLES